eukprot:m.70793 g.70793  ORF g.70793 m.70793 type:complete len:527 (+) comp10033_c0_seq1:73-1653(+)
MAATVFHEEAGLNVRKVDLERVGDGRVLQSLGLTLSHNHPKGVRVSAVADNSPAGSADPPVQVGDVIVEVNGTYVVDSTYFDTTTLIASAGAVAGAVIAFSLTSAVDFRERYGGADDSDSDTDDDSDTENGATSASSARVDHDNAGEEEEGSNGATSHEAAPQVATTEQGVSPEDPTEAQTTVATSPAKRKSSRRSSQTSSNHSSPSSPDRKGKGKSTRTKGDASPKRALAEVAAAAASMERVVTLVRPKLGGLGLEISSAGVSQGPIQVGVRVAQIKPNGAADEAGIKVNDFILAVNSRVVAYFTLSQVGLEIQAAGSSFELTLVPMEKIKSGEYELEWVQRKIATPLMSDDSVSSSPERVSAPLLSSPEPKPSPVKAGLLAAWQTLKKNVADTRSAYQLKQAPPQNSNTTPAVAARPDASYAPIDLEDSAKPSTRSGEDGEQQVSPPRRHSFRDMAIAAGGAGAQLALGQISKVKRSLSNGYAGSKTNAPSLEGEWQPAQLADSAAEEPSAIDTSNGSDEVAPV